MSAVMTPPAVLIPRERGATLRRKKVLSLLRGAVGEDGGLDDHTIGNSLIRVDALVGLLAVEEVGNFFDKKANTSGTTDQDNFKDVRLVDLVTEALLHRFKATPEEILADLFETGTSEGSVEIDNLEERVNFDGYVGSRRKGTLSTLASSVETTKEHGHLERS